MYIKDFSKEVCIIIIRNGKIFLNLVFIIVIFIMEFGLVVMLGISFGEDGYFWWVFVVSWKLNVYVINKNDCVVFLENVGNLILIYEL